MTNKSMLEVYQLLAINGLQINPPHSPLIHCVLGLVGEAGEIADSFKKSQYLQHPLNDPDKLRETVIEELGDALWYLTNLATMSKVTLEEVMLNNILKLNKRHGKELYDAVEIIDAAPAPVRTLEGAAELDERLVELYLQQAAVMVVAI